VSTDVLKKHSAFIMSNVPKLTKKTESVKIVQYNILSWVGKQELVMRIQVF